MKNSPTTNLGKRKGRPPKRKNETASGVTDDINFLDDESDLSFDEYMDTSDAEGNGGSKKRGRHSSKSTTVETPKDEESDVDDSGETKVDKEGHLQNGRQYRVPTFELPERGRMLFMFSKDPAALLGFRDSFVFMKKNPKLVKVHVTDSEKSFLVDTNKLRSTFRTREVSVVTARSVFKVFGHKVVKKGRRGRDDYYYTGEYDENEDVDSDDSSKLENDKSISGANPHWRSHHHLAGRNNLQHMSSSIALSSSTLLQSNNLLMSNPGVHGNLTGVNGLTQNNLLYSNTLSSPSSLGVGGTGGSVIGLNSNSNNSNNNNNSTPLSIPNISTATTLQSTLEPLNAYNWLHHAAVSVRDFSSQLHSYRQNHPSFYDIHTSVFQIPYTKQVLPTQR